jgi:hypothetical protein
MFDNYIIEVRPPTTGVTFQAGIIVRDGRNFRFFAASDIFEPLEGQRFDSPKAAEQAALRRLAKLASRQLAAAEASTASAKARDARHSDIPSSIDSSLSCGPNNAPKITIPPTLDV